MKTKTWGGATWDQAVWPAVYDALEELEIPDEEEKK